MVSLTPDTMQSLPPNTNNVISSDGLTFDLSSKNPQEVCPLCGKIFAQQNFHLIVHLVVVHKLWHCSMCLTYFTNTENRTLHEQTKHATTKCSICSDHLSAFDDSPTRQAHYIRKHSLKRCNFCDNVNLLRPGYYFKIHNKRRHKIVDEQLNSFQNFDGSQAIFEMRPKAADDSTGAAGGDDEFMCLLCRKAQLTVAMVAHFLTSHNLSASLVLEHIGQHSACVQFFLVERPQDVASKEVMSNELAHRNMIRRERSKLKKMGNPSNGMAIEMKSPNGTNNEQIYCSKCLQNYSAIAPKAFHDIFCNGYYLCHKCGRTEKLLTGLQDHIAKEHTGITCPFGCVISNQDTGNPTDLQHHLLVRHKIYLCIFCDESLRTETQFLDHLGQEHDCKIDANSLLILTVDKAATSVLCNFCQKPIDEPENLADLLLHYKTEHKSNLSALVRTMSRIPMYTHKEKPSTQESSVSADNKLSECVVTANLCTELSKQFSLVNNVLPFYGYRDFDPSLVECVVSSDDDSDADELDQYPKQCEYCLRSATISKPKSSSRRQLVLMAHEHMARHLFKLKPSKFRCCVCMKSLFGKNLGVYKHIQNMHNNITFETQKCPFCDDIFERRSKLRAHIRLHIDQHDYPCELKSLAYPCRYCHWMFWTVDDRNAHHMSRHSDVVDKDVLLCNVCGQSFSCKTTYRRHTKVVHPQQTQIGPLLYRCTICHTCYATLEELRVHMTTGHPCNSRIYYRNNGGKIFDNVSKLLSFNIAQAVLITHKYQCNYCAKILVFKNEIESHGQLCKVDDAIQAYNPDMFVCDICRLVFYSRKQIEQHMNEHSTKLQNFKCDQCGHRFKYFKNYYKHSVTHIRLHHKCSECPKVFGQKTSLIQHIRTHTKSDSVEDDTEHHWFDVKMDYRCFCCGQEFKQESELVFHEKQHEASFNATGANYEESDAIIKLDSDSNDVLEQNIKNKQEVPIEIFDESTENVIEIDSEEEPLARIKVEIMQKQSIGIATNTDNGGSQTDSDEEPLSRIKVEIKRERQIEILDMASSEEFEHYQRSDGNMEQTFDIIQL